MYAPRSAPSPNRTDQAMASRLQDLVKRGVDVIAAGAGLVLTSPIIAATAAAVALSMGRPVLFRQERPGKHEEIFELVKFRSMREADEHHVTDADRLTPVGRFIRATSLDELPTLWNVLKGEMSLVGPRPLLVQYLEQYSEYHRRRHEVRPGITGLAQSSGRNALSWNEKFDLDVEYVENRSLLLDAKVMLTTIVSTLRRDGVSADGHVTMPPFTGYGDQRAAP